MAYNVIAILASISSSDWVEIFLAMNYASTWFLIISEIVLVILVSSNINRKVKSLNEELMKMDIQDNSFLMHDGKLKSANQARAHINLVLSDFQGFNGNGFFVLNRPFLSSLVSNFLTYIIILVQFRISEVS